MFNTLSYDPQVRMFKRMIWVYLITCSIFAAISFWVPYIMLYHIKIDFMKLMVGVVTGSMTLATAFLVNKGWSVLKAIRPKTSYISLQDEDFACLVRGGILTINNNRDGTTVNIALKDIGFMQMNESLQLAMRGVDVYKAHQRTQSA